jgi:hypothetical protein
MIAAHVEGRPAEGRRHFGSVAADPAGSDHRITVSLGGIGRHGVDVLPQLVHIHAIEPLAGSRGGHVRSSLRVDCRGASRSVSLGALRPARHVPALLQAGVERKAVWGLSAETSSLLSALPWTCGRGSRARRSISGARPVSRPSARSPAGALCPGTSRASLAGWWRRNTRPRYVSTCLRLRRPTRGRPG